MLEIKNGEFTVDGKPFKIYSGAMHYFRILPEYWEDRLAKLKAAGLNTVETYVAWNVHEPREGEFTFDGRYDLVRFIETAEKLGLYVIVRPGPYICAEWDFGGFPSWLLKDKNLLLRCDCEKYMKYVERYFSVLLEKLVPHQATHGGGIIAMQVENEYGSYGSDKKYLRRLRDFMRGCGVDVQLFTSDGESCYHLSGGGLPEELMVINFGGIRDDIFSDLLRMQPDKPLMCGENWCGWFDHWGNSHANGSAEDFRKTLETFFNLDASFNLYMFHGGTNFGFTAGANYHDKYYPTVTSYDYDSPLNEYGGYTAKYAVLREEMAKRTDKPLPPMPPSPELQSVGKVKLTESAQLLESLRAIGKKHASHIPYSMEHYSQAQGLILYRTVIEGDYPDTYFTANGVHDNAWVWLDGELKGKYSRMHLSKNARESEELRIEIPAFCGKHTVEVLVQALGRVNFGKRIYDRKGIEFGTVGGQYLYDWDVYTIPLEDLSALEFTCGERGTAPVFLRGSFDARAGVDCFADMRGFTNATVFVNGFNLGRYLHEGPQRTLYIPGVILKEHNEITVLELERVRKKEVIITDTPVLG